VDRNAAWIYIAACLRSVTIGVTGVILGIYLAHAGFSVALVGLVIGAGLAGNAVLTVVVGLFGDRVGRRRTLVALALLTAAGYAALSLSTRLAIVIPVAFVGMVNAMGRDRGPMAALDQAVLPETTAPQRRTWALAWYNLVLDAGHALGALAGATPAMLAWMWGLEPLRAHQLTFLLCAALMLLGIVPYLALTRHIEVATASDVRVHAPRLDPHSRRVVTRLAVLFGLDSLGSGFLNSALIAYWFFQRHGMPEAQVALLFFAARSLNAVSHLAAAWLAHRIGLLNTMVVTHLPSSLFLMAVPAAPTATLAGSLFLAREALVEMDVPTRQSYVMAIVRPAERTLASSVTTVTRNISWAAGPALAGIVMQQAALAAPLFVGSGLKVAYDLLLYGSFRRIRPPEEAGR
jgi:MFS family permease